MPDTRCEQQCPATHERAVGPHLAGVDLHMVGTKFVMPDRQRLDDGRGIVVGRASPVGARHSNRQGTRVVLGYQVLVDPARVSADRARGSTGLEVGGHSPRWGCLQREFLGGADIGHREQSLRDDDRHVGRRFDGVSGGGPVGVAHPVLGPGVGVGGVRPDPGRVHRRGVEPHVVGVRGEQVHRPIPGDLVEPLTAR